MEPEKLANTIDEIIRSTIERFSRGIEAFQTELYNQIVTSLKELELDSDGYIKQSAYNRAILYKTDSLVNELLPGESFTSIISKALEAVPAIEASAAEYFNSISESFKENRTFISSLQKQTIQTIERTLLEDGLTAQIKGPLTDILNRS